MRNCKNCQSEQIPGARFCHHCGEAAEEKSKRCTACHAQTPSTSVFCHHCGQSSESQNKRQQPYQPIYSLKPQRADLEAQIYRFFFEALRKRAQEEHNLAAHSAYVERFYHSRFLHVFKARSGEIAREIREIYHMNGNIDPQIADEFLDDQLQTLLDHFLIQYCPDLNRVMLPLEILQYEVVEAGKTDLSAMAHDYLDCARERFPCYRELKRIPIEKLDTIRRCILRKAENETLVLLADLSIRSNGKEGFALTNLALHWKNTLGWAVRIPFAKIKTLVLEKDCLRINGHYFHVNTGINLKMYKLLKKIIDLKYAEYRQTLAA
jgi:hypothetical protein